MKEKIEEWRGVVVSVGGSGGHINDIFFFKQKTAYEIYQCDWSSDVCSSDLLKYQSDLKIRDSFLHFLFFHIIYVDCKFYFTAEGAAVHRNKRKDEGLKKSQNCTIFNLSSASSAIQKNQCLFPEIKKRYYRDVQYKTENYKITDKSYWIIKNSIQNTRLLTFSPAFSKFILGLLATLVLVGIQ